jgi:hypothetical protein
MIPEIKSKETRVKLTTCGLTFNFYPDMHWIADLVEFSKNPPGVSPFPGFPKNATPFIDAHTLKRHLKPLYQTIEHEYQSR